MTPQHPFSNRIEPTKLQVKMQLRPLQSRICMADHNGRTPCIRGSVMTKKVIRTKAEVVDALFNALESYRSWDGPIREDVYQCCSALRDWFKASDLATFDHLQEIARSSVKPRSDKVAFKTAGSLLPSTFSDTLSQYVLFSDRSVGVDYYVITMLFALELLDRPGAVKLDMDKRRLRIRYSGEDIFADVPRFDVTLKLSPAGRREVRRFQRAEEAQKHKNT
jgi:hypothetical protein